MSKDESENIVFELTLEAGADLEIEKRGNDVIATNVYLGDATIILLLTKEEAVQYAQGLIKAAEA